VRGWILDAALPPDLATEVVTAYRELCRQDADLARAVGNSANDELMTVAVRSSATAEDLPDASFAGQQEVRCSRKSSLRDFAKWSESLGIRLGLMQLAHRRI